MIALIVHFPAVGQRVESILHTAHGDRAELIEHPECLNNVFTQIDKEDLQGRLDS